MRERRKNVSLRYDSHAWLLETLRDLAPVGVAQEMIDAGHVVAPEDPLHRQPEHGAIWACESDRNDAHANMGTAVEGIVEELVAPLEGVEISVQGNPAVITVEQIERLVTAACMCQTWIGTNGDEDSIGFDADACLEAVNTIVDELYPDGHRELC